MVKKRELMLSGGLTYHHLLHGEKPEIFYLPRPNWYVEFVDERAPPYLRWKAYWKGEDRCLDVKMTAASNLIHLRDILGNYLSLRGKGPNKDLDFLVKLTLERLERWSHICDRINEQLIDPGT